MVLDAVQHKKQLADLSLVSFVHSEIVVQEKSAPLSYEVNNVQHHSFYQTRARDGKRVPARFSVFIQPPLQSSPAQIPSH